MNEDEKYMARVIAGVGTGFRLAALIVFGLFLVLVTFPLLWIAYMILKIMFFVVY